MSFNPSRLGALLLIAGLSFFDLGLLDAQLRNGSRAALAQGVISLRIRRGSDGVEVVIDGVGAQPMLQQRLNGPVWEGRLQTRGTPELRTGRNQLSDPSSGLQRVEIRGSGNNYELEVVPQPGLTLEEPVVSVDGRSLILQFPGLVAAPMLQTGRLDLNTPGAIPQARYAPALRPRAVAPPLGDMAVGTMVLQNRSFVNVSGPPVTLTLNNAPAKDALMALARLGGYGFVFVADSGVATTGDQGSEESGEVGTVSMAFQDESYARAINGVLLASGLQGKLDGRTLLVGRAAASKTFGPQISKVIRLNQVTAEAAAKYLGNLGATFNLTNTVTTTTGEAAQSGTAVLSGQTSQERVTTPFSESFGASTGPLRGLVVTTDARLQTVTLVGDSPLVAVAESYLKQIDLRQRQVALSVRILDINLDNDNQMSNSFAFRSGNAFIVSDNGQLVANFGAYKPPSSEAAGLPGQYGAVENTTPVPGTGSLNGGGVFVDQPNAQFPLPGSTTGIGPDPGVTLGPSRPDFGTFDNPLQPGIAEVDDEGTVTYEPPTRFQYPVNQFFDFLRAQIQSSSTKILASPTLIIQEGGRDMLGTDSESISSDGKVGRERSNEALVSVGTKLVTACNVKQDVNGNNFYEPVFSNAGLTFGARVDKIDDNGFITFSLSPEISAEVRTVPTQCANLSIINTRSLDTGTIRVRDGQTLILTGVISDSDTQAITKWPILGDIPFIGQFFRSSGGSRSKNELVILVTPRIINDAQGGSFGYGYRPSLPAARQIMSGS